MSPQPPDCSWLDARETLSLNELAQACALSATDLGELMEYGALAPLDAARQDCQFSAAWVMPLRVVGKLRGDFDLDLFTTAVLMDYLARIDALEQQVQVLKAALPGNHLLRGQYP